MYVQNALKLIGCTKSVLHKTKPTLHNSVHIVRLATAHLFSEGLERGQDLISLQVVSDDPLEVAHQLGEEDEVVCVAVTLDQLVHHVPVAHHALQHDLRGEHLSKVALQTSVLVAALLASVAHVAQLLQLQLDEPRAQHDRLRPFLQQVT